MKRIALILLCALLTASASALAAFDENAIAASINKYVGNDCSITVKDINNTLVLKGNVGSQYDHDKAEQIAHTYTADIKNMITIDRPESIRVEARIYVVDTYKADSLGVDWGTLLLNDDGVVMGLDTGAVTIGQNVANSVVNLFDNPNFSMSKLGAQLDFLTKNGAAQVISQPTVITTSGTNAEIRVGGQIVTPNVQAAYGTGDKDNVTTWKDYGILLHVEPTLLPGALITTRVKAEVSTLQWSSLRNVVTLGNGNSMPSIKITQAETVSTVPDGNYLAIGGLLYNNKINTSTKVPFLGDIPLLGWLFKSESTGLNLQEVIIIIQPKVVHTGEHPNGNDSKELRDLMHDDVVGQLNEDKNAK